MNWWQRSETEPGQRSESEPPPAGVEVASVASSGSLSHFAAVGAGGLWETRSVFQGVWEGAGAGGRGTAAFHTPADRRLG